VKMMTKKTRERWNWVLHALMVAALLTVLVLTACMQDREIVISGEKYREIVGTTEEVQ